MNEKHELHRDLGALLHHQLASVIRDDINSGRLPNDHLLPPELDLCHQFAVSRITVRRAMQSLVDEGLIERRRGIGTFVKHTRPIATMSMRSGMRSHMGATAEVAASTHPKVTAFEVIEAPDDVQLALKLKARARVLRIERMRYRGQIPIIQNTVYLPEKFNSVFSVQDFATTSLHKLMEREKFKYGRVELKCSAMLASPSLAKLFGILIGAPLIQLVRISFDAKGMPFEYLSGIAPPDRYEVKLSFEGSDKLEM